MAYDHLDIEARWQRYWDEHGTFPRAAGAIAAPRPGAQRSLPTAAELEEIQAR